MTPEQYYTEPPGSPEQEAAQDWYREACDLLFRASMKGHPNPLTDDDRARLHDLLGILSPTDRTNLLGPS